VTVAEIFLQNVSIPLGDNDTKRCLVTSVQMLGSGKTQFGLRFQGLLHHLVQKSPLTHPLAGRINAIKTHLYFGALITAKLFYVDCRDFSFQRDNPGETLLHAIYRTLGSSLSQTDPAVINRLLDEVQRTSRDAGSLADAIKQHLGLIFLHIDEVSAIYPSAQVHDVRAIQAFYSVWNSVLYPFMARGHFVYCSGRSPLLYYVGKITSLRSSVQLPPSPGTAFCLLLPWLYPCHVHECFLSYGLNITMELATEIFFLTGGVPRLVVGTVKFLQTNPEVSSLFASASATTSRCV